MSTPSTHVVALGKSLSSGLLNLNIQMRNSNNSVSNDPSHSNVLCNKHLFIKIIQGQRRVVLSIVGDTRRETQDIFPKESSSLPSNELGSSQSLRATATK